MSCSDFKLGTTNLRGMKRKLDMKLNGDRLRKQLTKSPSPAVTHRSKLHQRPESQSPAVSEDPLHHHNYHHQSKSPGDQLLCRLRQTMFNISLAKLSRYRHIPDPSLLRSVMICNTLKRLEKDLDQEGIKVSFGPNGVYFSPNNPPKPASNAPCNNAPTIATSTHPSSSQCPASSSMNEPSHNPSSCTPDEMSEGASEETFLLDLDSGGRVTPYPRNDDSDSQLSISRVSRVDIIDSNGDVWQAQCEKWSPASCTSCADSAEEQDDGGGSDDLLVVSPDENHSSGDLHELQPATRHLNMMTELGEIDQSMRNATLSSSSNPIGSFGNIDIDVNQYDFDMISPISPPNMRLIPVSAEELLKSVVIPNVTGPTDPAPMVSISSSSSSIVSSSLPMTASPSSCATQSTQSMISTSKQYYCKKESLFIDDCPTAIS